MTHNHITSVIEKGIEEFDKHLDASAPSMNKWEKAAALNHIRTFANTLLQSVEEECQEAVVFVPMPDPMYQKGYMAALHDLRQTLREARGDK